MGSTASSKKSMEHGTYKIVSALFWEKWHPYFFSVVATLAWHLTCQQFPSASDLFEPTVAASAILVGFLSTSKAILMGMNSPVIRSLNESTYMDDLISYIGQAIWLSLAFCVLNISGYFVDTSKLWFGLVWISVGVASLFAFIRVTRIMLAVFKRSQQSKQD